VSDHSDSQPVYIQSGSNQLFGVYHDAASRQAAVLIVAPWGWDETASYRPRKGWAEQLAAAGHPTLRFDLPGVGDSSGSAGDPGIFADWIDAVSDAARWLRDRSGRSRVVVLGLGLGGLLVAAAAEVGAEVDELVLWAVPSRGKRFLREVDSFARVQAWGAGRGEESPLPEGWVEAGGFVLSAETADALRTMPPPLSSVPEGLRRVLVLDRDGLTADKGLVERLESANVETTSAAGPGWGAMVVHPERSELPQETIDRVAAWLTAPDAEAEAVATDSGAAPATLARLELPDQGISERTVSMAHPDGHTFGIIAEPLGERADLCAVFLNAGAVRHIGPNRNWVENARRWAARGVPAIRVDLQGIGEAEDGRLGNSGITGFYDERYAPQIAAVLDELQRFGYGPRFVCLGLCSGAFWSLQYADRDPRVVGAVLLNAGAIFWDQNLRARRQGRLLSKAVSSGESWRRLLRGDVDLRRKLVFLQGLFKAWLKRAARALRRSPRVEQPQRDTATLFDRLRARDKRIALAFCANEPVLAELTAEGIIARIDQWPNIRFALLEGEDHALGPISAQRHAAEIVDRELDLVLEDEEVTAAPSRS
jgi:alpha-beta hydrolase superfamily lysophospholipase